jgi:hypothetical protein
LGWEYDADSQYNRVRQATHSPHELNILPQARR